MVMETEVYPDRNGYQLVVHRATPLIPTMRWLREFAADHGYVLIDARWRRWDRWTMILAALTFVVSGSFWILLVALWCGSDWARSFPRED